MGESGIDRNVVIASVLIAVILFGWLYFAAPPPPEPPAEGEAVATEQVDPDGAASDEAADAAADAADDVDNVLNTDDVSRIDDPALESALDGEQRSITITHDLYEAVFSTKGATLRSFTLNEYLKWDRESQVQMVDTLTEGSLAMIFTTPSAHVVDSRDLYFEADTEASSLNVESGETRLAFTAQLGEGFVRKIYTFTPGTYEVGLEIEHENAESFITRDGYELMWNGGIPFAERSADDEAWYAAAYAQSGGSLESLDLSEDYEELSLRGQVDWVSVKNKYFAAVIMPQGDTRGAELIGERSQTHPYGPQHEDYLASFIVPPSSDTQAGSDAFTLYVGPMEYYRISGYDVGLYGMVDFGWAVIGWIVRPLAQYVFIPTFWYLGDWLPSYGLAIIMIAFLIKMVLYPLTKSSYTSMAQMREIQPEMQAIKEKYEDDPQKQQQAMMKLYKESGVNPLGSCLPMLLQWPVLVGLYFFLQQAIEIRQKGFLWATDLSAPDPILSLPFEIPFYGDYVAGFCALMAVSLVIQMRVQGSMGQGGTQAKIFMYLMPGFLFVFFNRFPSGLSLYYLFYNIISATQQKFINRNIEQNKESTKLEQKAPEDLSRREKQKLKRKRKKERLKEGA
jgi:YidC/Oxa1 family membrane protein insertase